MIRDDKQPKVQGRQAPPTTPTEPIVNFLSVQDGILLIFSRIIHLYILADVFGHLFCHIPISALAADAMATIDDNIRSALCSTHKSTSCRNSSMLILDLEVLRLHMKYIVPNLNIFSCISNKYRRYMQNKRHNKKQHLHKFQHVHDCILSADKNITSQMYTNAESKCSSTVPAIETERHVLNT